MIYLHAILRWSRNAVTPSSAPNYKVPIAGGSRSRKLQLATRRALSVLRGTRPRTACMHGDQNIDNMFGGGILRWRLRRMHPGNLQRRQEKSRASTIFTLLLILGFDKLCPQFLTCLDCLRAVTTIEVFDYSSMVTTKSNISYAILFNMLNKTSCRRNSNSEF